MRYMLDTDICSYIIKQHPATILEALQDKVEGGHEICISAITYAELRLGAARSRKAKVYNRLIDELCERLNTIQAWDAGAADQFTRLQAALLAKGKPIGINDAIIAGHALAISATLVSNNQKHFRHVRSLPLENWC